MQSWEIKHHWVPVDLKRSELSSSEHTVNLGFEPTWKDDFKRAWAEAEVLANEGWELVSVAAETAGRLLVGEKNDVPLAGGTSYTVGYMLAFRRPKQAN